MTAPTSGTPSTAPLTSPAAVEVVAPLDGILRDGAHRAAIRAMPRGLVPLDVLLSLVRDEAPVGVVRRAYRAPWTERDETSARSCSTPRTRSALIAGVRR